MVARIDIEDLREYLGSYIDRSQHGERFLVVENGQPVAELGPLRPLPRQALADLSARGAVDWQGGKPRGLRGVTLRGEPLSETIVQARR